MLFFVHFCISHLTINSDILLVSTQYISFYMQILCWGVRNMKKYQLANVSSPNVQFEVGGNMISSSVIKNTAKNPNFDKPTYFFDVVYGA